MTNSDIEIEFAVNGYILRTGIDGSRLFHTVDELAEFLEKNLDEFHAGIMKSRDTYDSKSCQKKPDG